MKLPILFFISLFSINFSLAQDSLVVYDVIHQNLQLHPPVTYDTSISFNTTQHAIGSLGNRIPLPLSPPSPPLLHPSSLFSAIAPAHNFYDISDYPIRTGVLLRQLDQDTITGPLCSGIMVGPDMVLTAAHCVKHISNGSWHGDSIMIAPAYDNGHFHPTLPTSTGIKYYMLQRSFYNFLQRDLALIQLREPIGLQIGWIGMAYQEDLSYFDQRIFHKLSYPSSIDYADTSKVYNGDTLFYNYGHINTLNILPSHQLGVLSATGIGGQSGSSLFYTDNDSSYYTFGVMSLSTNYRHAQLTAQAFYTFQHVLQQYGTLTNVHPLTTPTEAHAAPNPFQSETTIYFENPQGLSYQFELINTQGQCIYTRSDITTSSISLQRQNWSAGLYFFRLKTAKQPAVVGKLLIQD